MDGVLVDFDGHFKKVMPGVENEDDFRWQDLHKLCPDMYLEAPPMADMNLLLEAIPFHAEVCILTAIPRRWSWPNVTKHKRAWANKHLTLKALPFPVEFVHFGPYAEDKQYHCEGPYDILIDDKLINIEQWRSRGGIGIHHLNAKTTVEELVKRGIIN